MVSQGLVQFVRVSQLAVAAQAVNVRRGCVGTDAALTRFARDRTRFGLGGKGESLTQLVSATTSFPSSERCARSPSPACLQVGARQGLPLGAGNGRRCLVGSRVICSLVIVVGLTAAGVLRSSFALADVRPTGPSIEAFDQAIEAGRRPASGGNTSVTRAELRNAIGFFLHDDGNIDGLERAHLAGHLGDPSWLEGISGPARKYAGDFVELNADGAALIALEDVQVSLVDLFGAPGALTSSVWVQEGRVTSSNGMVTQSTLRTAYGRAFNASASMFDPINLRELVNELSGRLEVGTPTQDEVDGAVAYLSQIGRTASRLYLASWIGSSRGGGPGDVGGVVMAAVSSDRRFVRFVEVHVWSE
jgi:hypothetical protein